MKRFLYIILVFVIMSGYLLVWAQTDLPKPSEIVCTCGCGQKAVKCGDSCSVALELLKPYKGA